MFEIGVNHVRGVNRSGRLCMFTVNSKIENFCLVGISYGKIDKPLQKEYWMTERSVNIQLKFV